MSRLVLINGAPGSGKSTIAWALAQDRPLTLALDIDGVKHVLARWEQDPSSGSHARRLGLALAGEQLRSGLDVIVGQYLARTAFIEALERLADDCGAQFAEYVLQLDAGTLAERLAARVRHAERPEHEVNNRLVGPGDAVALVRSLEPLRHSRPRATWIDARGSLSETLVALRSELNTSPS